MNGYLLDTQALVLYLKGSGLPAKTVRLLRQPSTPLYVSLASAWEFLLKRQFRDLGWTLDLLWTAIGEMNARLLSITKRHVQQYELLPQLPQHKDPFNRMFIAQSLSEGLTLVSGDRRFKEYPGLHVQWK